ncbi:putative LRR receptor-like serine/threonine-protein kinase [Cucurbita argyrosperma subsp. argyrosperma]|nr:putative LRR receptor-like serine/threonine-protein kinase [Cucurbita argyrosperma subsp. argyrosperma]
MDYVGNGRQVSSTIISLLLKSWFIFFWVLTILCNSKLAAGYNRYGGRNLASDNPSDSSGQLQFSISAAKGSDLPPILNGFEIYSAKEMQNASTVSEDADAMMGVKQAFRLIRNWEGDPCFPSELIWAGLTCSNSNASSILSM